MRPLALASLLSLAVVLPASSAGAQATTGTTGGTARDSAPAPVVASVKPPLERRVTIIGLGSGMLRPSADGYQEATVTAPAARLYEVLPQVYADLGIPMKEIDQPNQTIGTGPFRAQFRLAKQRLSQYVDCGVDAMGLRQADSYTVTLHVNTQVLPLSADRATVRTLVQANGRPASNSGVALHCPSSGRLEERIAELAAERLNR